MFCKYQSLPIYCYIYFFQIPKTKMWIIISQMFPHLLNHAGGKDNDNNIVFFPDKSICSTKRKIFQANNKIKSTYFHQDKFLVSFLLGLLVSKWLPEVDFSANAMGRTRFKCILTHLHLIDNMSEVRRVDPRWYI